MPGNVSGHQRICRRRPQVGRAVSLPLVRIAGRISRPLASGAATDRRGGGWRIGSRAGVGNINDGRRVRNPKRVVDRRNDLRIWRQFCDTLAALIRRSASFWANTKQAPMTKAAGRVSIVWSCVVVSLPSALTSAVISVAKLVFQR